jgi:hypothetical protein
MGQLFSTPQTPPLDPELRAAELRAAEFRAAEFRAAAIAAGTLRRKYSEESQAAWRSNRKAEAKTLSDQSKEAWLEVERFNALAAELIFTNLNPEYPVDGGGSAKSVAWIGWLFGDGASGEKESEKGTAGLAKIDLHGLYVTEAIERVNRHLEKCRDAGVETTIIITGRGLHSQGGVAKIKPEVEKWLQERVAKYRVLPRDNEGAFTVELVSEQTGAFRGVWRLFGL